MKRQWIVSGLCVCLLWLCFCREHVAGGPQPKAGKGLVAHYYRDADYWGGIWPDTVSVPRTRPANHTFSHYAYTRVEPVVNHRFIRSGWFSVRWEGWLTTAPAGGTDLTADYTFYIWADDGCRLLIDGKEVISDWRPCAENDPRAVRAGVITLAPGRHRIVVEYFQGQSLARQDADPMKLYWQCPARNIPRQIIPASHLSHVEADLAPRAGRLDD